MRQIYTILCNVIMCLALLTACATLDGAPKEPVVEEERETIWDLFDTSKRDSQTQVNKYLWRASMDVLSFLPLEAADPFTGVIITGWGTAPGSSQRYRATVYIQDAALDARSLKVSIQTSSGAASVETQRQIEDAILTRARQLRIESVR